MPTSSRFVGLISDCFTVDSLRPYTMKYLLPFLPEYFLPKAVDIAVTPRNGLDLSIRRHIIGIVAARLPQAQCDELFKEQLQVKAGLEYLHFHAILALAPYLSPLLLQEALYITRREGEWYRRELALTALIPHLPESIQQEVALEVFKIVREQSEEFLVPEIASYLPKALLQEAAEIVRMVKNTENRIEVQIKLIPYLSGQARYEVLQEIVQTVQAIASPQVRLEALINLQPYISELLVPQTLAEAQRIVSAKDPSAALQELILVHIQQQVQSIYKSASLLENAGVRAEVLTKLLPYLPEQEKPRKLQEVWQSTEKVADGETQVLIQAGLSRAEIFIVLLPILSGQAKYKVLQETLEIALTSQDEQVQVAILVELALYLTKGQLEEILRIIQTLKDVGARAVLLARLLPSLAAPLKHQVFREILESSLEIEDLQSYAEALVLIIPYLPELLPHKLLEDQRELMSTETGTKAQTRLTPLLTEAFYLGLLPVTEEIKEKRVRVEVLIKLIPCTCSKLAAQLVIRAALDTARSIERVKDRVMALTTLVEHLPDDLKRQVVQEIVETTHTLKTVDAGILLGEVLASMQPKALKHKIAQEILGLMHSMIAARENSGIYLLADIAPYLSRSSLHEAVEIFWMNEPNVEQRSVAYLLSEVAPYLSEQLLLKALEIVQTLTDEFDLVFILSELAPNLSEQLLLKALKIAQTIANETHRTRLQARLTFYLDSQELGETVEDELSIFNSLDLPAVPAMYLQNALILLPLISEEEKDAVLEEMLNLWPPPGLVGGGYPAVTPASNQGQIVNTGFAPIDQADHPLMPDSPLACNQSFYFWLEVGPLLKEAIDVDPASLPPLPEEARLKVALFALTEGVEISSRTVGELQLQDDGSVLVTCQPSGAPTSISANPDLLSRRLFFLVHIHALERPGIVSLSCNIYYEQILIQARLIRARITPPPPASNWALRSGVVYKLVDTIHPKRLEQLAQHKASIMVAHNADDLSFCFLGTDGQELFKTDASCDGQEVQDLIEYTRRTLRRAAWGTDQDWQKRDKFRYNGPRDLRRLQEDLFHFAISGYRIYDKIIRAGGLDMAEGLERLMREPGLVQIAVQRSPRLVPPIALVYDYPLITTARFDSYTLCPTFVEALKDNTPLEELECFKGYCPTRDKMRRALRREQIMVCPSGFWGYRHGLGIPLSIENGPDVAPEITYKESLHWLFGFSTDFRRWEDHQERMYKLWPKPHWDYADTWNKTLDLLETTSPHLIYFYCHGGVSEDGLPYIQVGSQDEQGITPDNLPGKAAWEDTRPLIFINGCHTTALEPEKAIEFVSTFIKCGAAGVIGTEITVFESLACKFAEECLHHFLQGVPIGEAVRKARLALLQMGNPLGLVYIPFVLPSLCLRNTST